MAFKAVDAVEAMEYDLNPYVDNKGVIPEPTSDQVNTFFATLQKIALRYKEKQKGGTSNEEVSTEEALDAMTSVSESLLKETEEEMCASVESITSGKIPGSDFKQLPFRVQQRFMQWLGESFRPEDQTPATKR